MRIETVAIDSLAGNPKNYRGHPDAQVDAIRHSLDQFGQYRPVVVSSDGVILAGHGVWLAQKATGATDIDTVRMDFPASDPRAEKLMVADNELSRMAQDDDRALAALLADIQRTDGLNGTGWDDGGLDALIGKMAAEEFGESLGGYGLEPDKLPNTGFHFSLDGEEAAECNAAITKALADLGPEVSGLLPVDAKSKAFLRICEEYLS